MVLEASALSPIDFARLPLPVSLTEIQQQLTQLAHSSWLAHVNRRDYRGGWEVLPLRCQRQHQGAHPILQGFAIEAGDEWADLPVMEQLPAVRQCLSQLHCSLKAVRFMRLQSGAQIKPHRDYELGAEFGQARLHLSVHTHQDVVFSVNNQRVPMGEGEWWYINADQIHAVENRSACARVNLVVDCVVNDWLNEQLLSNAKQATH